MEVIIKAFLESSSPPEVRRIPVAIQSGGKATFKEVFTKIGNAFPGLADKKYSLKWKDADGDLVTVSTDEELQEALAVAQNSLMKIFITVEGVKENESEEPSESQPNKSQEPDSAENKSGNHQKQDPFGGLPYPPYPGSGFTGFGGPRELYGMGGHTQCSFRNFRPHGGHFNPRGHFNPPGHFNPRGHFSPRGHHVASPLFGHHVASPPFGHCVASPPFGNLFGEASPKGHHSFHGQPHFGHHMGMFGPEEVFEGGIFQHHGHHGHHHGKHHHGKHHHGDESWKAKLREAVPVAHRRWTKEYIQNWRLQNLKNATSTSSDSEHETRAHDAVGVPEAYVQWLNMLLPKWHKCLIQNSADDTVRMKDKRENKKENKKLKASIPTEYRKWTKWYLARRFGWKEEPIYRTEPIEGKACQFNSKTWKKACKLQTLGMSIPSEYRLWTSAFIQNWRQERNIPDPKAAAGSSSEGEDSDKKANTEDIVMPDNYIRWLQKFLAKWHLCKGLIDEHDMDDDLEDDDDGDDFEDAVTKNFRKWVKCFMWHRYGKGATLKDKEDNACQYQKWLSAFQKKWIQEQSKNGSKEEYIQTSSDDDSCSFSKYGEQCGRMKDNGDAKISPSFWQWMKNALWNWDGVTHPGLDEEAEEQITPHMYHWMSKKMMKMQMKRMKKEFKHSMKAATKAHKYRQL